MARTYTAEELIESIRNLGMVPDAGTLGGNDADILRHMNEEMMLSLIPELIRMREEFLVVTEQVSIAGTTLKHRIPKRAIGDKLRYVRWIDANGNKDVDEIPEVGPIHHNEFSWSTNTVPNGYYIEGNYICLIGSTFTGSLELSYHFRPGELVLSTSARQITVVNTSTKTVTLASNVPTNWDTNDTFDIHSTSSGAEIKVWDKAATVVSGTTVTFSTAIDGSVTGTHPVEVGDWICLAGEAAVPALPKDLHPLLVRATGVRMAEAQGDAEDVRMEHDLLVEAKGLSKAIMQNRAGKPKRLVGCKGILWRS